MAKRLLLLSMTNCQSTRLVSQPLPRVETVRFGWAFSRRHGPSYTEHTHELREAFPVSLLATLWESLLRVIHTTRSKTLKISLTCFSQLISAILPWWPPVMAKGRTVTTKVLFLATPILSYRFTNLCKKERKSSFSSFEILGVPESGRGIGQISHPAGLPK